VRYTQIKYLLSEEAARAKVRSADKIRSELWERLERMETIYLDEEDLVVTIGAGKITIKVEYEEVIEFPGGYEYSLWFSPSVTEEVTNKTYF